MMLTIPTTILMALCVLFQQQPAGQAPTTKPAAVTNEHALAAIDRFMANPSVGEDARTIIRFAEDSPDVLVNLHPAAIPWMDEDQSKEEQVLTTAYLAGNVRSQLKSGKNANDSYAGVLAAIEVYKKLQEKNKDLKVAGVDRFIEMESKGELKAYLEKNVKER
jgi:hypothetical protein